MHNNNNNRRNGYNNNRRFNNKNNNNNNYKRRNNGGGGSGVDDESTLTTQQRKNFANKRDQLLEKAKDSLRAGDRIEAENFFQHAEHCFRMMNSGLNGAQFDPYRGHVQNGQHEHNNGGAQPHVNVPSANQENNHQEDNNSGGGNSTEDISALPFMRTEMPNVDEHKPRVIE